MLQMSTCESLVRRLIASPIFLTLLHGPNCKCRSSPSKVSFPLLKSGFLAFIGFPHQRIRIRINIPSSRRNLFLLLVISKPSLKGFIFFSGNRQPNSSREQCHLTEGTGDQNQLEGITYFRRINYCGDR